jgi:steroid delta-isomerase-like uncharacterized protein
MDAARLAANKALIARWFEEVWNQGRTELIDEMRARETVATGLADGSQESRGPEPFKAFYTNLRIAFPDLRVTVDDVLAEGDKVAARISIGGTHMGDALGAPPTGKTVQFSGIILARIEDGKIVQSWNSLDLLSLLKQIGAVSDPAGADRFLLKRR